MPRGLKGPLQSLYVCFLLHCAQQDSKLWESEVLGQNELVVGLHF